MQTLETTLQIVKVPLSYLHEKFSLLEIKVITCVLDWRMTPEQLKEAQVSVEEKVYQIWTVLSAFEESAAACISDMLLNVSNGACVEGVKMADSFLTHVEVLFKAIDDLFAQYSNIHDAGMQKA